MSMHADRIRLEASIGKRSTSRFSIPPRAAQTGETP
jgi:hypothetical protein